MKYQMIIDCSNLYIQAFKKHHLKTVIFNLNRTPIVVEYKNRKHLNITIKWDSGRMLFKKYLYEFCLGGKLSSDKIS